MNKLSDKAKSELYNFLITQNFIGTNSGLNILDFLSDIWPLASMPSEDSRFTNAYEDIWQHMVNNDDWDIGYLFQKRLPLFAKQYFEKFIETVVSPKYRADLNDIERYVLLINPYIESDGFKLAISEYSPQNLPIYTIQLAKDVDNLPIDIKKNKIPFFVRKSLSGRSDRASSHITPEVFPSFVLAFNGGWNDYGILSTFSLFYYANRDTWHNIGVIKIIQEDNENTSIVINDEFYSLNEKFCSLGQSESYYQNMKELFEKDFESILFALSDAVFNQEVLERHERKVGFRVSLLRSDAAERLLREIKYKLNGYDLSTFLYKFKYTFQPAFSDTPIDINFDFNNDTEVPSRIYGLIGKNGTGKTQLITSLPINIANKESQLFIPTVPLFSKVIAVSYSVFDAFEIPKKTAAFNYVHCGLRSKKGDVMSENGLVLRFHSSWKKIESQERINKWRNILLNFIDVDILNEFLIPKDNFTSKENSYEVDLSGFRNAKNKLSSGQSIVLYIITEIVAHIRYDSLLIYDEPETHLHPNAITQLMNTIYELVSEFQSYCILATHSPLVIRELFSRNVYVLERDESDFSIRRIGLESFGENTGNLIEEVFGNKTAPKQYKKIISELISSGKTFEEIIELLEFDDSPLSLNARLYLKSLITPNNEKP